MEYQVYRGVWCGHSPSGEPCAVKKITTPTGKERREFEALAKLRHPNIVHYLGYEEKGSSCYIVMELCDCSLKSGVGELPDPIEGCRQLTEALRFVHGARHAHRDLKPDNVLIKDGVIKLADFGLAKNLDEATMTLNSTAVGTRDWMSPEGLQALINTLAGQPVTAVRPAAAGCYLFIAFYQDY